MRQKTVFCVVGLTGSGKSHIASNLAELFNCNCINIGDIVRSITKKPLELKGNDKLAVAIFKRVNKELKRKNNVILDGIREAYILRMLELEYNLVSIAVVASRKTRLDRYLKRELGDDLYMSHFYVGKFKEKTKEEKLIGVLDCMEIANSCIDNN